MMAHCRMVYDVCGMFGSCGCVVLGLILAAERRFGGRNYRRNDLALERLSRDLGAKMGTHLLLCDRTELGEAIRLVFSIIVRCCFT